MGAGRRGAEHRRSAAASIRPVLRGRRRLRACQAAGLAAVVALACGPDVAERRARDPRPNVLLVSMDTTRADHLSAYGYPRPTSRFLTSLAEQGVRVEAAYSPSATTGPSHASLFTALPPIAHGVRKNGHTLADPHETLAERLSSAGYETGAVVSSFVLSREFGYDQGFADYDDDVSRADTPEATMVWEGRTVDGRFYGSADDTTDRALRWLRERSHPEDPFFLFVHYFDPHDPYLPPADYRPPFDPTRKEALKLNRTIFLYDTLLAFTDREIGRLLEALEREGLADDTLVVVTGDHGEGLMTHGHMYHGVHVYEEAVRVPLIVRWPGRVPAGRVVAAPFAIVDLAPAILELAGVESADALGARGLAARLLGEPVEDAPAERVAHASARPVAGAADTDGGERPVFLYRRHYTGTTRRTKARRPAARSSACAWAGGS